MRPARGTPARNEPRAKRATHLAALEASVRQGAEARPGVYRMLAEDGSVLYVGQSKRLRVRLLSYFRCKPRDKGARILRHTRRIDWETTPSEFAARLEELRLIKRFRPRFNVTSKRDLSHYAWVHLTGAPAPKLVVRRASQGPITGEGLYFGPFLGPERVEAAVRELSDALGLRDCSDEVPLRFRFPHEPVPRGLRAPGCLRYDVHKCLGPCVAGCTTSAYDERVRLAQAFLEGSCQGPLEQLRREMEQASATLAYERAALYRDKLRRLEALHEQFGHLRFALEALSFVYPVPGFQGDDRVYLVRRGTVRAERTAPRSTAERFALQRMIDEVFQPVEPSERAVRRHEVDEILLVSSWFRRYPEELARTWQPG